jgi:hypothetical protein
LTGLVEHVLKAAVKIHIAAVTANSHLRKHDPESDQQHASAV